jgi:hemoglobin
VDANARDAWLAVMNEAVAAQDWAEDFKLYLMQQLAVPAERVRIVSEQLHSS